MLLFGVFFVKIECEGYQDSFGNIRNIFQVSRTLFNLFRVLTSLRCNKWFTRNLLLFFKKNNKFQLAISEKYTSKAGLTSILQLRLF